MKLNKTFGRVATTLVAAAMLASLAAPVYAVDDGVGGTDPAPAEAGVQVGENDGALDTLKITKKLVMPDDVVTSAVAKFTFTLEGAPASSAETIISGGTTFDVKSGTGTVTDDVTFEANSDNDDTATVEFKLNNLTFTEPGVYKYQIKESTPLPADFIDATTKLDVYLFVEDTNGADTEDGIQIYAAVVKGANSAKTDTWTNNYMMGATGSLEVTKAITGDMASPNDVFKFTISGLTPGRTYVVESDNDKELTKITASPASDDNPGGTASFSLKAEESFTIKGLIAGEYVITEADSGKGYKLTTVTGSDTDDKVLTDGADVTLTSDSMDKDVIFTNERVSVSPTGLVMDIAPYALLVVVAAVGCFVFLRKRSED